MMQQAAHHHDVVLVLPLVDLIHVWCANNNSNNIMKPNSTFFILSFLL